MISEPPGQPSLQARSDSMDRSTEERDSVDEQTVADSQPALGITLPNHAIVGSENRGGRVRRLLDTAAKVMPESRISRCFRQSSPRSVEVMIYNTPAGAKFHGLYCCGDIWMCPRCSTSYLLRRREELLDIVTNAVAQGYHLYLLTLTMSHRPSTLLADERESFGLARRRLFNRRTFQDIRKRVGKVHRVRAVEVTHGENGWHYHSHEILLVPGALTEHEMDRLNETWIRTCQEIGGHASLERGFVLQPGSSGDSLATYVSGVVDETSCLHKAARGGNRTVWQILEGAGQGSKLDLRLIEEYSDAMRGQSRIQMTAGTKQFKSHVTIEQLVEKEAAEEAASEYVISLTSEEWNALCSRGLAGRLIDIVESDRDLLAKRAQIRNLVLFVFPDRPFCSR